jgi:hypothetical protein
MCVDARVESPSLLFDYYVMCKWRAQIPLKTIRTNVTIHKIRVLKSSVATKKNLINQPMQLTHPFSWKSVCVCASVCVDRDPFYD